MKALKLIAASTLVICTLAACGGGGGGSTSALPPVTAPPAAKTILNGIASKGPFLKDSTVKVYAVTNGVKGSLLTQTTTTDNNGSYSADLGSYTGPVLVEVSGSFHDEATGNNVTVAVNAPIRAALPLVQGTVTLPITPLTELAVQKATTLAPAAITAANTLVSDLFKVDIVATLPVAPTTAALADATQAQKDYTLALAAVSQLASGQAGATDGDKLKNALDTLSQGITSAGMSSSTSTVFQGALTDFVANPNNQTGVSDTTGTSLVNAGTLSKSYTIALHGNSSAANAIQFDLVLPTVATVNVNSQDSSLLDSSFAFLKGVASDALTATGYQSRTVTIGIVTIKGISAGGFATLTCNIAPGQPAPPASAFAVNNLKVFDVNGSVMEGVTLTVE